MQNNTQLCHLFHTASAFAILHLALSLRLGSFSISARPLPTGSRFPSLPILRQIGETPPQAALYQTQAIRCARAHKREMHEDEKRRKSAFLLLAFARCSSVHFFVFFAALLRLRLSSSSSSPPNARRYKARRVRGPAVVAGPHCIAWPDIAAMQCLALSRCITTPRPASTFFTPRASSLFAGKSQSTGDSIPSLLSSI